MKKNFTIFILLIAFTSIGYGRTLNKKSNLYNNKKSIESNRLYFNLGFGFLMYRFTDEKLASVESNKYTTQGDLRGVFNLIYGVDYILDNNSIVLSVQGEKSFYLFNHFDEKLWGKMEISSYSLDGSILYNFVNIEKWEDNGNYRDFTYMGVYLGLVNSDVDYYGSVYDSNTHSPVSFYAGLKMGKLHQNVIKRDDYNSYIFGQLLFNSKSDTKSKMTGYKIGYYSEADPCTKSDSVVSRFIKFGYEDERGYLLEFGSQKMF